ncbi:MAG: Flp family type IVb pilin [Vicinamibacterales bacterium]
MAHLLNRLARDEDGQDLIEYAFLAVFLILSVFATLQSVGTAINTQFTNINTQVGGS